MSFFPCFCWSVGFLCVCVLHLALHTILTIFSLCIFCTFGFLDWLTVVIFFTFPCAIPRASLFITFFLSTGYTDFFTFLRFSETGCCKIFSSFLTLDLLIRWFVLHWMIAGVSFWAVIRMKRCDSSRWSCLHISCCSPLFQKCWLCNVSTWFFYEIYTKNFSTWLFCEI